MSPLGAYSFLPWLRHGVGTALAATDGDATVKERASIHVALQLSGDSITGGPDITQPITRDVALYGPGDIVGIDSRAIVRTEPRAWVTNFESNYLAAIDFYDEDFPWRYTPAGAGGADRLRLRPWIALVVLKETEFSDGAALSGRPLPYITVPSVSAFPPADDLWAWAHVHFNQSLSAAGELVSPDMGAVLPRVEAILGASPDLAYSRLLCPRQLEPDTGYHAFIVPVFETGRLAGLGNAPDAAPYATFSAWAAYAGQAEPSSFPYYYRWYFRTGSQGDFEFLVRLLQPRPVDSRVGTRNMDVQDPGSNLPGILDSQLGGVLRVGGALRVPRADLDAADLATAQLYDNWFAPYPHPFQKALASFINLADDYAAQDAAAANAASGIVPEVNASGTIEADPDPLITAPLYGCWHALTRRLLTKRDGTAADPNNNWVHQLNLDPQYRVPAGFGTNAVEANAETYLNAAWEQIGDVLTANRLIRRLQLAKEISWRMYVRHITPVLTANVERTLSLTAPIAKRVVIAGKTVTTLQRATLAPPVLTSTLMRKLLRPGDRLMRSLPFNIQVTPLNLIARINAGVVSAAPVKVIPSGALSLNSLTAAAAAPPPVVAVPPVVAAPIAVAHRVARIPPALPIAVGIIKALGDGAQVPASVDRLPRSADFTISEPGSAIRSTIGTVDSVAATRFKSALHDSYALVSAVPIAGGAVALPPPLDLQGVASAVVTALDPQITIVRRGLSLISLPPELKAQVGAAFNEVMNYPKIDVPMYEPLANASIENLLPNLNLIPVNSITLLETNQKFIEAYMVGVNHEFARKLLWSEYPTDQRGSYFRQFWDVRSSFNQDGLDPAALKEQRYDIPPLQQWAPTSNLGEHNNRAAQGTVAAQAVLAIRGELLKKYPTAVIFAQHARWFTDSQGNVDTTQPRVLDELSDAEAQDPPASKMRFPLYEAKAEPDIYFFGFDLTIPVARGGTKATDDAGWFFVIKERPGEPRFGLELDRSAPAETFDDLTWVDAIPGGAPSQFLPAQALATITLTPPAADDPEQAQNADDSKVAPASLSAARWAYVLLRAPALVAVHAARMLPNP